MGASPPDQAVASVAACVARNTAKVQQQGPPGPHQAVGAHPTALSTNSWSHCSKLLKYVTLLGQAATMASEEREPTLEELMAELDAGPDILAPPPPAISKPVALPASDTVGDDRCAKPVATTASAPAKAKRPDAIARPVGDEGNDPTGSSSSAAGAPKDEFAQLEESFYQAQSLVKSFWKSTRETLKETAASAQQSAQHAMHSQHIGEMADVLNNASRELRATAHDVVA